ncbi:hypothetical protein CSUI_007820 [Cystoisospora suis]|uniref:Uncharacterized protein n=1 Tax=Cystoisospora suis TaxID=483139 RepID=A0A2C6KPE7_9APIC|nr:hypothetical protein CSUI_007820 [Cystoisospora suis]
MEKPSSAGLLASEAVGTYRYRETGGAEVPLL